MKEKNQEFSLKIICKMTVGEISREDIIDFNNINESTMKELFSFFDNIKNIAKEKGNPEIEEVK